MDSVHTDGYEEDSSVDVHASQSSDDGATSKKKLTANEDVRNEGK